MPIVLVRKAEPSDDPLILAAERMEPGIRDAFIAALGSARDSVTLAEIVKAVEAGDAAEVMRAIGIEAKLAAAMEGEGLAAGVESVRDALRATFAAGAAAAKVQLPRSVAVDLSFNLKNPAAVEFLNQYSFNLIKDVTQVTRDAIKQIVTRAFEQGGHPYEQARAIRDVIGLTPAQEQAVASYRAALESGGASDLRNALERALRDGRYDAGLLKAIDNATALPQARVDKMVESYRKRFIEYRARTIARTESLRASNVGQYALHRQAMDQGLLGADTLKSSEASGDDRTCIECLEIEDQEPIPLDDEFTPGYLYPPFHVDCRCSYHLVFPKKARDTAIVVRTAA